MPRPYRFTQVDVFTARPYGGNQLAVFTDARGLTEAEMQTLAREMNFSETTFVLPPEMPAAVKRVRIFTPANEMPFAGHPTIGTAFVLASEGLVPLDAPSISINLQLNIGLMPITIAVHKNRPGFVWMEQRPAEFSTASVEAAAVAAAIGVETQDIAEPGWPLQVVSTGVPYLIVPLRSLAALRRAHSDTAALQRLLTGQTNLMMVYLFTRETEDPACAVHARMFCGHVLDLPEDAATGSAAGPLGAYLVQNKLLPPGKFIIEQGIEMHRPSQIHVEVTPAKKIIVGGQTVKVGEGIMYLD